MSLDQNSGDDRRRSQRLHVEGRVRLFANYSGERIVLSGQMNDLSEGGLSVYVSAELEIGQALDVEVTLPYSASSIRARVVIRSRDNHRYGLQFTDVHPGQQQALARACKLIALVK